MTFLDLSHTIEHGMTTHPGLPGPVICDFLSREASRGHYAPGVEFQIGKIEMVANTGTYVDSPFHRYPNGQDLSELLLANLADVEAVVVRARGRAGRPIDEEVLAALGVDLSGKAVLFDTGWSRHFGTEAYGHGHPFLTEGAARHLV